MEKALVRWYSDSSLIALLSLEKKSGHKDDVAGTQSALGSDVTSPNLSGCVFVCDCKSGVVSWICLHVCVICVAAPA